MWHSLSIPEPVLFPEKSSGIVDGSILAQGMLIDDILCGSFMWISLWASTVVSGRRDTVEHGQAHPPIFDRRGFLFLFLFILSKKPLSDGSFQTCTEFLSPYSLGLFCCIFNFSCQSGKQVWCCCFLSASFPHLPPTEHLLSAKWQWSVKWGCP